MNQITIFTCFASANFVFNGLKKVGPSVRSANFLCQGFSIFARIMNMMCKCALFLAALLFFISSATTQKVLGIPNKQKWNFRDYHGNPVACLHQKWKKEVDETWDMLSKNMDKIWDIWKKSRYHENTRLCLDHHVSDSTFPLCSFSLIDKMRVQNQFQKAQNYF